MLRAVVALVALAFMGAAAADELRRAQELAWAKSFAESETVLRRILTVTPASRAAQVELARVVMWQGRYVEALALFDAVQPQDAETLEGRATAEYWSGDLRAAARDFRRALDLDPAREIARRSLAEIASAARPSQRLTLDGSRDDQPLDTIRAGIAATFFSDPQTRWTVTASRDRLDAERFGRATNGESVTVANESSFGNITAGAALGLFTFPDGIRRAIGSVSVQRRSLALRLERQPELNSATSLTTHAASTTIALRWNYEKSWSGSAEMSHRRYSDGNVGRSIVGYALFPLFTNAWTVRAGGSAAARDTEHSRFGITAISSTREGGAFDYRYRGEYDPYWTPDDLIEGRVVVTVERRFARGELRLHGDAGYARDRGRAFGPDTGTEPFPTAPFTFAFDRSFVPWRAGVQAEVSLTRELRLEAGVERSVTVDYRATSFHAALVRRR